MLRGPGEGGVGEAAQVVLADCLIICGLVSNETSSWDFGGFWRITKLIAGSQYPVLFSPAVGMAGTMKPYVRGRKTMRNERRSK